LISLLVVFLVFASVLAYMTYAISTDVVTEVVVENPGGSKTALVMYHPGLSSFAHDVAYAFTEGLVSNGWRVEIATPSSQAPSEPAEYDLLVLCFSTYGGQPDSPTMRQIERVGDLEGVNLVLVGLAAGDAMGSKARVAEAVLSANGNIVSEIALNSMAPNEGNKSATELAEQAGREISA
jgi:hypothetical protein